ncbi:MAG TPA: SCO family protein [Vicinamibacterales bacterium]|nr:SCO family protein [Vicinamibacterales bacterium]
MGYWAVVLAALSVLAGACDRRPPPKQYKLTGQVLAVNAEYSALTIKHEDIPDYMPAMTMTYNVAAKALLDGRKPGELITGTLETGDGGPRLIAITHTGEAPLPPDNEVGMAAGLLEVGEIVPDVALVDQHDQRKSFNDWRGSLTLITFIYTRCPLPNFCPLMDQNFAALQRATAKDPKLAGKVKLLSISFDPEFDTPAVLAAHAAKMKADPAVWTFATADRVTIDRLAGKFGVNVVRTPADAAQITHTLRTTLIDADGRIVKFYTGNDWTPGAVLADMRTSVK